ncbi:hypothetical protein AVEN_174404-1 [Araneus ventricosus]|uniref:Reverse transcriptase domain-containing protein n=1 Tax=Araneus ventricosus TaxID=182803 RepID=A0A4Y2H2L8_ARAVE|nr:hypothetical protein AVEN_174404-1 [Araneus ventricosus]
MSTTALLNAFLESCSYLDVSQARTNSKLPGNYRPISLLSNLDKIYEKVLPSIFKDCCSDLNIIPGFRPNHGCIHQLIPLLMVLISSFILEVSSSMFAKPSIGYGTMD